MRLQERCVAKPTKPRLARIGIILGTGESAMYSLSSFHLVYSDASKGKHKPAHPNCADCQFECVMALPPDEGARGEGGAAAVTSDQSDLHGIEMYNALMGMSQVHWHSPHPPMFIFTFNHPPTPHLHLHLHHFPHPLVSP